MTQKRLFSAFVVLMSFATFAAASETIDAKYKAIGAATLGKPAGKEKASSGGRVRLYAGGGIWSSKTTGTHAVYGPAFDKYKSLGAERGKLGYPVTDVDARADGGTQTLFRHGYVVVDKNGAVTAEVMPKATFTADSLTLKGMKAEMKSNEAFVQALPQTGPGGSSYQCNCVTGKNNDPGTGSCDLRVQRDVIRCAQVNCRNNCRLIPTLLGMRGAE